MNGDKKVDMQCMVMVMVSGDVMVMRRQICNVWWWRW